MLPAEHTGRTQTRNWYKVRWLKNPHPSERKWDGIEGRTDLMIDEDIERYKGFVDIIETVRADTCATGLSLAFGKLTERQVDDWIKRNRK